jgi:hypothetical protein
MPFVRRPMPAPASEPGRSRRLPPGISRLFILCVFVVLIGMARPRLTPGQAGLVVLVCGLVTLAAAMSLVIGTWWIAKGLPLGLEGRRLVAAVRVLLRRVGLPLLGLAFFLFWTFFYVGLWWYRPEATFAGLSAHPYFADFFYYAVSTSFIAPPGDIIASSRGARTATMIEMLTGFALVTAYLASLFEWRSYASPPKS